MILIFIDIYHILNYEPLIVKIYSIYDDSFLNKIILFDLYCILYQCILIFNLVCSCKMFSTSFLQHNVVEAFMKWAGGMKTLYLITEFLCFPFTVRIKKNLRSRQGSNLRGKIPLDFKSNALTTRPRLLVTLICEHTEYHDSPYINQKI